MASTLRQMYARSGIQVESSAEGNGAIVVFSGGVSQDIYLNLDLAPWVSPFQCDYVIVNPHAQAKIIDGCLSVARPAQRRFQNRSVLVHLHAGSSLDISCLRQYGAAQGTVVFYFLGLEKAHVRLNICDLSNAATSAFQHYVNGPIDVKARGIVLSSQTCIVSDLITGEPKSLGEVMKNFPLEYAAEIELALNESHHA